MQAASITTGNIEGPLCRREVIGGLAFWFVFCIVAVLLRGVQWDEQYEFAQLITGSVQYPEGHPYPYCTRNALNLQIYATSLLYWLTPSPAVVCGFRNVLSLMATVLPVFLLGTVLSGRALWGSAAVALILMGIHQEFDACYQMFAWPSYASIGHFGRGYALATLALLLGGNWRAGLFLLGLMPCVHIGQMPILLAFSVCYGAGALWRGDRQRLLRALPWAALGLGLCAVVWVNKGAIHVPLPTEGPYFSSADPHSVWAGFIAQDGLRALPGRPTKYTNSFIILAAMLLLGGAVAWAKSRQPKAGRIRVWAWVWLYVLLAAAAVWGIMAIHSVAGARIPYLLIAWMPYRFANHAAYILLAALPAVLVCAGSRLPGGETTGRVLVAGALLFSALRPLLGVVLPGPLFSRYVAGGEGLLFGLCGAAAGMLFLQSREDRVFQRTWQAVCLAAVVVLAVVHQFGTFCALAGFAVSLLLYGLASSRAFAPAERGALPARGAAAPKPLPRGLFAVPSSGWALGVMGLVVATLLFGQWRGRQHLATTPFDQSVVSYLEEHGEQTAMLLARPEQYTLQAKTGHPVMADTCLASWIPYMPTMGPTVQKIHHDFYGTQFEVSPPGQSGGDALTWSQLWQRRTVDEWQALSREYALHYVIAPNTVPLDLPIEVAGDAETLYRIPAAG